MACCTCQQDFTQLIPQYSGKTELLEKKAQVGSLLILTDDRGFRGEPRPLDARLDTAKLRGEIRYAAAISVARDPAAIRH